MCKVDELQRSSTSQGSGAFVKTWQWRQWLVSLSAKKYKLKTSKSPTELLRSEDAAQRLLNDDHLSNRDVARSNQVTAWLVRSKIRQQVKILC